MAQDRRIAGIVKALALVAVLGMSATAGGAEDAAAPHDAVLRGDAKCTRCHDESSDFPVFAIGKTRHGVIADSRTPTCTDCHGESDTHINKPEGATSRPPPTRTFGMHSTTPTAERNGACLTCHAGGARTHWQTGPHANADLSCTSCHKVHTAHDEVRDKEKRGPFVRTHQPVQENCAICHQPHGTTLPNLLRERPPFLCQSCHEPTSHRGNMGSLTSAGFGTNANTVARGCVNCHTNIHGTNNPSDISNERTLRR
jgi:predicted CXXCH cytochrome family protein